MGIRATVQEGGKPPESSLGRGPLGGGRGPGGSTGEGARDSAQGRGPPPPADTLSPSLAPVALDTQHSTASVPGQVSPGTSRLPGPGPDPLLSPAPSAPPLSFPNRKPGSWAWRLGLPHLPSLSRHPSLSSSVHSYFRAPEFQPNHLKTALTRETVHGVLH